MFDYQVSKHPHFDEACRAFALRHNLVQLAERAGMNVQILRNKLNPAQPHLLTAPEIWLLTDLTEDSTLVDGFLAQIHCLPCVPINEVAKEKLPHYVMSATAEIGRVAAGAVSGDVKTSAGRRDAISSINSVTRRASLYLNSGELIMRNIEILTTKTGSDDAGLNILLTVARLEERRARAEAMAARLDSLACHISSRQLNHVEAAELLRVTAEAIQNEAQEIH